MPARTGTMHDLTGRPSAMTAHCAHWPLAQKMPWGAPSLWWCPKMRTPLAKSAEAIVSPSRAWNAWPCQLNGTSGTSGTARIGCSRMR